MEGMISKKQEGKFRFGELLILFTIVLLLIPPGRYLISVLRFPYPLEYREPASIIEAIAIHQGINPFTLDNYPQDMYIYGLIYPYMISPWINVIQPIILIPRLIDFIFLALTITLFIALLRFKKASIIGSLIGASILLNALCLVLQINGSRPDIPALFFSLAGIYIVLKKGTAIRWLFVAALCMICCLLLKEYLIIPIGLLLVHIFVFHSKKTGIIFFGILSGLVAGSAIIIRFAFPLYLRYAILHPLYILSNDTGFMWMQVSTFLKWYGILCLFFIGFVLFKAGRRLKSANQKWHIDLASWDSPLLEGIRLDFLDWGFVCIMIIMMVSIGQNTGNFHTYFQELSLPFLILAVIPAIEQWIQWNLVKNIAYAFCLFSLIPLAAGFQTKFDQYFKAYQLLESKMNTCNQIYGAPITDMYLMDRKLGPIFDNGLSEFGYTIIMSRNKIFQKLLGGNDGQLENKWNSWNSALGDKVKNREFDCIVAESQVQQIGNVSIANYYIPESKILDVLDWDVVTYNQQIDITIWIPKE
jgi:hypothetical protein